MKVLQNINIFALKKLSENDLKKYHLNAFYSQVRHKKKSSY